MKEKIKKLKELGLIESEALEFISSVINNTEIYKIKIDCTIGLRREDKIIELKYNWINKSIVEENIKALREHYSYYSLGNGNSELIKSKFWYIDKNIINLKKDNGDLMQISTIMWIGNFTESIYFYLIKNE